MRQAEEPLRKVTLNIFASDYDYLRSRTGWHQDLRNAIHAYVTNEKRKAASVSQVAIVPRGYDDGDAE